MTKDDEDPIVGAGAANKPPVWDKADDDSPLPEPQTDREGRPRSDERPPRRDD